MQRRFLLLLQPTNLFAQLVMVEMPNALSHHCSRHLRSLLADGLRLFVPIRSTSSSANC